MKRIQARAATQETFDLAEGPVWDDQHDRLIWVDITAGRVHQGILVGDHITVTRTLEVDSFVGAAVPGPGEDLLVAGRCALHRVGPDGRIVTSWPVLPPESASRLNDGSCDPAGRFLVGSLSLGERRGDETLVRLEPSGQLMVLDDDLALSNGLGWSPDGRILYSVDTIPGVIWRREYDVLDRTVGPRHELFHVPDGSPDGLAVDVEGNLWVAVWGAGQVRRHRPDGKLLAVVDVPAPHTSSVAFVGPQRDRLLITTARAELSTAQLASFPESGRLFLADPGVTGVPTVAWQPVAWQPVTPPTTSPTPSG